MPKPDVGWKINTCPVCFRSFVVTPLDDVFWPACGCYDDAPAGEIPCEECGLRHAARCPHMPQN